MAPREASAYPWNELTRLSRRVARLGGRARRLVDGHVRFAELRQALRSVLGAEVELVVERVELRQPTNLGALVELKAESLALGVSVEPELVSAALSRVIGRTPALGPNGTPLDPALAGAFAAMALEVARRARGTPPLRIAAGPAPNDAGSAAGVDESARLTGADEIVVVDVTLIVDGRSYACSAWARLPELASSPPGSLAALGEIPLALTLVVGASIAERGELERLRPGDAFMPGPGLWIDDRGRGSGVLAAPCSERGPAVDFLEDGRIVLRGKTVGLAADLDEKMAERDDTVASVEAAALEAPLVVRVELCSVSLTARQWADLKPGDVLETGRKIGEKVVLRVAGREVARGDLVNVEGELGVRVSAILSAEGSE
jgi:flagellar motor switch/type III secretory pathway protein FliN